MAHYCDTVYTAHARSAFPVSPEVGVPEVADYARVRRMRNARLHGAV